MKILLLLLLSMYLKRIESRIQIDIVMDSNQNPTVNCYGEEYLPVTETDFTNFFKSPRFRTAMKRFYKGRAPDQIYYSKPTPWGDLYTTYDWEPVTKKIEVKYARLKVNGLKHAVVLKQDFDNPSNRTITVDTELNQSLQNTVTTTWRFGSSRTETLALGFKFGLKIEVVEMSGSIDYSTSTTSSWGVDETKAESTTIGSAHKVHADLKAGESMTAELSVATRYLEIEVGYKTSLEGQTAVHFHPQHEGHYFYGHYIDEIMLDQGIENEQIVVGSIRYGFNIDAKVKVSEKRKIGYRNE